MVSMVGFLLFVIQVFEIMGKGRDHLNLPYFFFRIKKHMHQTCFFSVPFLCVFFIL